MDGNGLYRLVEDYAACGDHRAGTSVDHLTAAWMASQLADRGLTVEVDEFPFARWQAEGEVTVAGEPVDWLGVHREWDGPVSAGPVHAVGGSVGFGGEMPFDDVVSDAVTAGAVSVVLATEHHAGSLVAVNRAPAQATGFPVLLVAGREAERLADGEVRVDVTASTVAGRTANVLARNDMPGDPLVIGTPMTGWFRCAGERATGIAVLLELVERFADRPLLVVASTAHEFDNEGLHRWITGRDRNAAAVVHVGAAVASEEPDSEGGRRLASTRLGFVRGAADGDGVAEALEAACYRVVPDPTGWLGEGAVWQEWPVPILSLSGMGPWFHTPEDVPEASTSPASLVTAADAVADAVAALLGA